MNISKNCKNETQRWMELVMYKREANLSETNTSQGPNFFTQTETKPRQYLFSLKINRSNLHSVGEKWEVDKSHAPGG